MSAAEHILPFFPADAMAEYDGIFAAGAAAADAEIARLTAYWAERAAESERAYAEAKARSDEVVRRRREYESAVIFLINPHKVRYVRDRNGRTYVHPRYINLGPRRNWTWDEEANKYVDERGLSHATAATTSGCYYRTAAELGLDNTVATRHYEDKTYLEAWCGLMSDSSAAAAHKYVIETERTWARTLAAQYRRAHALNAFAARNNV